MKIFSGKKFIYTIFGAFFFALLFLFTAEFSVRMYIHLRYNKPGKTYGIYKADKELGVVHRPNSYNINSVINNWGFRNTNDVSEKKPEGAIRIYCSGGSMVFCYNLSIDESWPSVLQYKLRQIPSHENDEVLNAGEICFSVSHEFVLAKRLIPILKPDIVILHGTGINEVNVAAGLLAEGYDLDKLLAEKKWGIATRKLDQARFMKRHSTLVKLFDYKIKSWLIDKLTRVSSKKRTSGFGLNENSFSHEWVMKNFEHTLRAYIRFLHHNGCKVIFVRWADSWGTDGERYGFDIKYFRPFRELGVKIGKEEGAVICDFASALEQYPQRNQLFINSGVHLTKKGAELLAETLIATLRN